MVRSFLSRSHWLLPRDPHGRELALAWLQRTGSPTPNATQRPVVSVRIWSRSIRPLRVRPRALASNPPLRPLTFRPSGRL